MILRGAGYAADAVADGRAALAYLRSHPAPRLIVLDLMMPVMDGWQFLAERLKDETLSAAPVVVFSATAGFHGDLLRRLGAGEVVRKPATDDELLAAVRHYY